MTSTQDREGQITIPLQYNDSHWKGIFEKYDLDGDGKISYNELKAMIRSSSFNDDIPPRVVRLIMHKADLNDSGFLEYPEFIAMIHRKDMQGVFGSFLKCYVHTMVPQRPTLSRQQSARYIDTRVRSTSPSAQYPVHYDRTMSARSVSSPQQSERYDDTMVSERPRLSTQQSGYYSTDLPDGQYEEEYSCRPPAVAMIIISLIEIILFIYDYIAHPNIPSESLFIYNPYKRYEAWRYLTYMFVHVGEFHLVVNLLVQIMLGIPLEMVHKWWRVLIIYIAGVVAGSLGTSVSDPGVFLAGASGGVYALITAHVATILMNWREMEFAILQLCVFLIVTAVDVSQAIYNRYVIGKEDQIGYVAHFAGAIAGLLVGINVLRNLEVQTWEKAVWWASIFTYTALMTAAILWNILYPSYFPPSTYA